MKVAKENSQLKERSCALHNLKEITAWPLAQEIVLRELSLSNISCQASRWSAKPVTALMIKHGSQVP